MVTAKKPPRVGACGSFEVVWIYGFEVLTTILTIYRSGLRGFYGLCGMKKHGFRTKKHEKARKMRQKTDAFAFGTSMPQVRILSLRPIPVFIRHLSTKIAVLTAIEAAGETLRSLYMKGIYQYECFCDPLYKRCRTGS